MIIDPISAGVGVLSAGFGIFQGIADAKARKQDYLNQSAFQDATSRFNAFQAKQNAQLQDVTSRYNYWSEVVNFNQQLAYTNQLRNYDLAQEIAQADKVRETRTGAGVDYLVNAEALSQRFAEEGMQRAVGLQQYNYRALQQSAAFQAMAGEGNSSDRIVNNFARQAGDYATLQQINEKLAKRQYDRSQLSQVTQYLSKYNSQTFYEAQQRMDPIMPFPPLPTMVTPPPPSMTGAKPGGVNALTIGNAVLGGANAYLSTAAAIKQL